MGGSDNHSLLEHAKHCHTICGWLASQTRRRVRRGQHTTMAWLALYGPAGMRSSPASGTASPCGPAFAGTRALLACWRGVQEARPWDSKHYSLYDFATPALCSLAGNVIGIGMLLGSYLGTRLHLRSSDCWHALAKHVYGTLTPSPANVRALEFCIAY